MKKTFIFLVILFNANVAFGYITENIPNGCDISFADMYPMFTPNEYTCLSGYYLPADTLGCIACPSGYTCSGGTYKYNANTSQGIELESFIPVNENAACDMFYNNMFPLFTRNSYTCSAGYYLPAGKDWLTDNDGCVICPADSYCNGGTYTFNETVTQGIESCPNNWYSPAGSSSVAQCGRILHVGDNVVYLRSVKKTTPSLHIDINNDNVADFFGNMTTLDVPMNINTERKLKIRFNNTTYSVYDDTVDLSLYGNE